MKKYKQLFIILNLLLLLSYFAWAVIQKETLLKKGQLVLLELAPVDPRSLMQGDYMQLRYKISEDFDAKGMPKRGYCVVRLDKNGIADGLRFQKHRSPLNPGEQLIEYASSDNRGIHIGAESFFFQEGQSKKYEKAKYGGIKIDSNGNSLLICLFDEHLLKLE
jgi:uncharacterized membrane-anchored protein